MEKTTVKILTALPQMPRLTRVAAYARVSAEKYSMLVSMSMQVSYYSQYIQHHPGWTFAGVYADEAMTGTKADRPRFQQLLEDCRVGKIDMILTKSISRFARNTVTLLNTIRELKALGIDIYFERENIHSISEDGELMLTLLASYAQEESRSVSENCKWRIRNGFKLGKPTYFRIYGYRMEKGKLVVVPKEAEIVRMIFSNYLSGMGIERMIKKFIALSIPAPEGDRWYINTISGILKSERYVGDMLLQKYYVKDHIEKKRMVNHGELNQYYVHDCHEAIIDRDTFDAVQKLILRRKQKYHSDSLQRTAYPFTGILRCCCCGAYYRRKITNAGTKYAKPVWICNTFNTLGKSQCQSKQIPENILLAVAAKAMKLDTFSEPAFAQNIERIDVTGANDLLFIFKDGQRVALTWQDHSRKDSWTDENKRIASERQKALHNRRRASCKHPD